MVLEDFAEGGNVDFSVGVHGGYDGTGGSLAHRELVGWELEILILRVSFFQDTFFDRREMKCYHEGRLLCLTNSLALLAIKAVDCLE